MFLHSSPVHFLHPALSVFFPGLHTCPVSVTSALSHPQCPPSQSSLSSRLFTIDLLAQLVFKSWFSVQSLVDPFVMFCSSSSCFCFCSLVFAYGLFHLDPPAALCYDKPDFINTFHMTLKIKKQKIEWKYKNAECVKRENKEQNMVVYLRDVQKQPNLHCWSVPSTISDSSSPSQIKIRKYCNIFRKK